MKIYIVAPDVRAYFTFINNLYKYQFIKKVSKELQIAVIHPDQTRGLTKQLVFILDGTAEQNPFYKEIYEGVINRKNTVICCSPLISREAFTKLIFAASV